MSAKKYEKGEPTCLLPLMSYLAELRMRRESCSALRYDPTVLPLARLPRSLKRSPASPAELSGAPPAAAIQLRMSWSSMLSLRRLSLTDIRQIFPRCSQRNCCFSSAELQAAMPGSPP